MSADKYLFKYVHETEKEARSIIEEYLKNHPITAYGDWICDRWYGHREFFDDEIHFNNEVWFDKFEEVESCIFEEAEFRLETDKEQLEEKARKYNASVEPFDFAHDCTLNFVDYLRRTLDDFFFDAKTKNRHALTLIRALFEFEGKRQDRWFSIEPPEDEDFPEYEVLEWPVREGLNFQKVRNLRAFSNLVRAMALMTREDELEKVIEQSREEGRKEQERIYKEVRRRTAKLKRLTLEKRQLIEAKEFLTSPKTQKEREQLKRLPLNTLANKYIAWRQNHGLETNNSSKTYQNHLEKTIKLMKDSAD